KNKALLNTMRLQQAVHSPVESSRQRVKGTVTDDKGEALPGVNIVLKRTSAGTTSDLEGHYELDLPEGPAVLIFSFVGYVSREVEAAGRSIIDIQLEEDNKMLKEVVVTALGMKREKRS